MSSEFAVFIFYRPINEEREKRVSRYCMGNLEAHMGLNKVEEEEDDTRTKLVQSTRSIGKVIFMAQISGDLMSRTNAPLCKERGAGRRNGLAGWLE